MNIVITTFLFLGLMACQTQTPNCKTVKDGRFSTLDADGSVTYLERNGSEQIEIGLKGTRKSRFNIEWLNDCEYLVFGRTVIEGEDLYPEFNKDTLWVRIDEVRADEYVTTTKFLTRESIEMEQIVTIEK